MASGLSIVRFSPASARRRAVLIRYAVRDAISGATQAHDPETGQFIGDGGGGGSIEYKAGGAVSEQLVKGKGYGQEKGSGGQGSGAGGPGGARSPDEAQGRAAAAAAGQSKLAGLPDKPLKVGDQYLVPGPFAKARAAAARYMRDAGLPYDPPKEYLKVDKERATRIAAAFDQMKHDPDNPTVQASYEALANETVAQWHAIKNAGLKVEWIKEGQPDPYAASPRLAAMDVIDNNHWWGFPTDAGFGSGKEAEAARHNNPMLKMTDEVVDGRPLMVNDVFRIVHDYFGHFKEGVGFRADGEENAWRSHSAMYSELARGAMTSETRGQNSWVNFGPHGESNRTASAADTHYAPQKIGLMPEWTWNEGRKDPGGEAGQMMLRPSLVRYLGRDAISGATQPHDPATGEFEGEGGGGSSVGNVVLESHPTATLHKEKKTAVEKAAKKAAAGKAPKPAAEAVSLPAATPEKFLALTANTIKAEAPEIKARSRGVPVVAKEVNERAQRVWKSMGVKSGKVEEPNSTTDGIIRDVFVQEIKDGLFNGHAQADWYSDKMKEAMRIATLIHPEIAKDPKLKFAFIAALAITSQGERVNNNAALTEKAYAAFEKTGRFPTDVEAIHQKSLNGNFKKLNAVIDNCGGDFRKVVDWLNGKTTVKTLEAAGFKISNMKKGAEVYRSAILGPKIGEGFYQNIQGNFKPLTVDMWFMRTWGRITGTGIGELSPELDKAQTERLANALAAEKQDVPDSKNGLLEKAREIERATDRRYVKANKEGTEPADKTELESAAQRYVLTRDNGMVDMATAGQREWITKVFISALAKLQTEGIDITPAAAQATIWNPEKVMYERLGARTPPEADYAAALKKIAESKGIAV